MNASTIFTTTGHIRQSCRHAHRTEDAARRCLSADRSGCARWGGYSDRVVVELPAGLTADVHEGRRHEWLMDAGNVVTTDGEDWTA